MEEKKIWQVASPLNGRIVPLGEVPDPVFADRILGDGCAILPEDGKLYSPVNGRVTSIADSLHAYGFESDDGAQGRGLCATRKGGRSGEGR